MTKQDILDALEYIGIVDVNDFNLKDEYFTDNKFAHSYLHGKAHVYRVMIGTALLAKALGEPRLGRFAFCAAFLHDQNRIVDGIGKNHGLRAAELSFPNFTSLWDKYGLSPNEREYVQAACADHCANDGHDFKKHPTVRYILKDADALDRYRIHPNALNTNFLHYQKESRDLIKPMEEMCDLTNHGFTHDSSFMEFIVKATSPGAKRFGTNRQCTPEETKKA